MIKPARLIPPLLVLLAGCSVSVRRPGDPWGHPPLRPAPPSTPAPQTTAPERTIQVSATAEAVVPPDLARITLAVETLAPTADSAAQANAAVTERVLAALRQAAGPDDHLETGHYTLSPEYRYDPGAQRAEQRVIGYRALNQITLTTHALPSLGAFIDAALAAGANRVAGVTFDLADPTPHRTEALRRATQNARAEAVAIAEALGLRLGEVVEARSKAVTRPLMECFETATRAAAAPAPTPVEPRTLTVATTVTLRFQLVGATGR